jgi:hypothetical protein
MAFISDLSRQVVEDDHGQVQRDAMFGEVRFVFGRVELDVHRSFIRLSRIISNALYG